MRTCRECGHGITVPTPSEAELKALYDQASYYSERGMAPGSLAAHRGRAAALRAALGGRTFLDVGAGTGALVAAAAQMGYEVAGTEVSPAAVRLARERFGVELRPGPFGPGQFGPEERFDVLTMVHVLEHLPDPLGALSLARTLVGERGIVFVEVPNLRAFAARFPGPVATRILDLPYHLHHFTPRSLERALVRSGLEPISVRASIPEPLDRGFALAARLVRGGGASGPSGGHGRTMAPEAPQVPPGDPVHAGGASGAAGVLRWIRRNVPGFKLTAMARSAP